MPQTALGLQSEQRAPGSKPRPAGNFLIPLFFLLSLLTVSCDLFNSMPENNLEKKIDEKVAYAKAPWVPIRIETEGLGITNPPPAAHDKLVKLGYSFKLVFVPDSGYPFRGWQAWVEGEGIRSLWKNNAGQDAAYHPERVRFEPLNPSGAEVEIFVYEMPPEGKRLFIGPLGVTNDELTALPDAGGLGTIYPARLSGIKREFPFTMSFQPSSAYPFRGWQAKFVKSDGALLAESVWAVEGEGGEQRENGVVWSPQNASGLEMRITIEETPEGFAPTEDYIIIGPLGMDSGQLNVQVTGGGLGTAASTLTTAAPARQGYSFTVSFQPESAYPFQGWQALFFSGDDLLLAESTWAVEGEGGEQRENSVFWSPQNASGLEMRITIEETPEGFAPAEDHIIIGPLGMGSGDSQLRIVASAAWGVTNPPPGNITDKKLGFPFTVEFAVASGWAFQGWIAYSYDGTTVEGWSRENPGVLLGDQDVSISNQEGGKAEVTVYTSARVTLIPYCIERPKVLYTNLPGYFDDRKVTNYPIKIWFSNEIDDECRTWDNFIITAETNRGYGGRILQGNEITKYYNLPEINGKQVSISRNMDEKSGFVNLNITVRLNLGGIYDKTDKVRMGEPGQYQDFLYGVNSVSFTEAPTPWNLEAAGAGGMFAYGNEINEILHTPLENRDYYAKKENGEYVIYLFFDRITLDTSLQGLTKMETVKITEKAGEPKEEEFFTDAADDPYLTQLANEYKDKYDEPYIVRHVLQAPTQGIVELAVQPVNDLGYSHTFEEAYKVQVILDTTPPSKPVTSTSARYEDGKLTLEWDNPANPDPDFDGVLISYNAGAEIKEVKLGSAEESCTLDSFSLADPSSFSLRMVDFAGNASAPVTVTDWTMEITVADAGDWNTAVSFINHEASNKKYDIDINVTGNFNIPGVNTNTFTPNNLTVNISGNQTIALNSNGSLLRIGSGQIVTLSGLTLQGRSNNNASLVYVNGGIFTMSDGTISNNNYPTGPSIGGGGGVSVSGTGTFNMSGGTISNNTAVYGGGVSVTGATGTFNMSGGTISNNTAGDGGGVFVFNIATFNMSGGTIGGATTSSRNTANFGGGVCVTGATFEMTGGTVSGNTASVQGGGVRMDSGTFTMSGGEISGNTASSYGGGVFVNTSGKFTMNDGIIGGTTTSSRNTASYGGGVLVYTGGTFTMSGGTISGNRSTVNCGGVGAAGTFNMNGGTISNNTADGNGGGVGLEGTFTMSGGTISGNTATGSISGGGGGGGVSVVTPGTFTMSGGEISGNNIARWGGGVWTSGTSTMRGGTISGNTATSSGGGVCVDGGFFYIVTGTVYGSNETNITLRNTATQYITMAALHRNTGTAERGTFSGANGAWVSAGSLSTTSNTIRVVNGQVVQ